MQEIVVYIRDYFRAIDKKILAFCTVQTAILIFFNYHDQLENKLSVAKSLRFSSFTAHFLLFSGSFTMPYIVWRLSEKKTIALSTPFFILLVVAPAIFALKMSLRTTVPFSDDDAWNQYWNIVYYWPLRLLLVVSFLLLVWLVFESDVPFYGLTKKRFRWKPYFFMLLLVLPLISLASTQTDFLLMYPKIRNALSYQPAIHLSRFNKLVFELSYGSDFLGIEIFFRGFLVLAFARWVGINAILPMACFYCTIHFGKPLGECISSYFGGLLLGVVSYRTQSIYGGLIVHVGLAWMMELGGYVGNSFH